MAVKAAIKEEQENSQNEQPKPGLHLSENKETLYVTFKNKQSADIQACIALLQNILLISSTASYIVKKGAKAPRKFEKTRRIRADINTYVNREKVTDGNIDELISLIRTGKVRKIKTVINERERTLTFKTDFTLLLVDLLAGK